MGQWPGNRAELIFGMFKTMCLIGEFEIVARLPLAGRPGGDRFPVGMRDRVKSG